MKRLLIIVFVFVILFSVIYIFQKIAVNYRSANNQTKVIAASIYPVYLLLKEIAGDKFKIIWISEGQSMHEINFRPEMLKKLLESKIIFTSGYELDSWAEALAIKYKINIVRIGEGGPKLITKEGYINPHFYLSFAGIKSAIKIIADSLSNLDPINKDYYQKQTEDFLTKLNNLKNEYEVKLSEVKQKPFLTYHDAFLPLFQEFKMNYTGSLKIADKELPAKDFLDLINRSRQLNVKIIFNDEPIETPLVQNVAKDLGLKIIDLDPLEIGDLNENFFDKFRLNLERIYQGLKNDNS